MGGGGGGGGREILPPATRIGGVTLGQLPWGFNTVPC